MFQWVIWLLVGGAFIFMGLSVHIFKWYFLIAGYNTMPKEQKANVDIESVSRLMGYWGYFNGAVSMLVGLLSALGLDFGIFIGLGLFGISTVFMIITAQKFDYNPKGEGRMGKSRRRQQFGSVGVTVVSLVVVVLLLLFTMRPTNITIDDAGITIHGMYGQTYAWESISEMELIDELPGISRRTNGASVGPYLKGRFRTTDSEAIKLFVNRRQPPFIRIVSDVGTVIFNMESPEATRSAAAEIQARLK